MATNTSPLRYPGGKAVLSTFLAELIRENGVADGVYVEPYAGGAGAALNLLFGEHVREVVLNDIDRCVFSFWRAVLNQTETFTGLIRQTRITMPEWKRQRAIYRSSARQPLVKLAFAGFYLNRCNRSGIMVNGGPIGGVRQTGKWKLNARFNKPKLTRKIERIALYKSRIVVRNMDALAFLKRLCAECNPERTLIYLDPPYYDKGSQLYLNYYTPTAHRALAEFLQANHTIKWVLSYDDVPEVRHLYQDVRHIHYGLNYSANSVRRGREILFFSDNIDIPAHAKL